MERRARLESSEERAWTPAGVWLLPQGLDSNHPTGKQVFRRELRRGPLPGMTGRGWMLGGLLESKLVPRWTPACVGMTVVRRSPERGCRAKVRLMARRWLDPPITRAWLGDKRSIEGRGGDQQTKRVNSQIHKPGKNLVNPFFPLLISITGYGFTKNSYSTPARSPMQHALLQSHNHISYNNISILYSI